MGRMKTTYTNCTDENIWEEDLEQLYVGVFQVVFPILIVMGILTNILNLVVLTRPMMRNKSYRWLRALGVVDLLLCLLTTPVCLAKAGHGPSPFGVAVYYSHFGWSLSIGSQIVSFYLMGWFAYDRYLAVCQHTKYPDSQRYKVFRRRVLVTVVGVAALYLPTMVEGYVCREGEDWIPVDGYSLGKNMWWYTVYSWVREILSRVVPAVVLTFCNVKITLRLKHLRSIWDGFGSGVSPARRERERRLVRLLFWVTALFCVFNAPVTVYYLGFLNQSQNPHNRSILTFGAISNLLQMMGNISNFVLYFLVTPDFQRTLMVLLRIRTQETTSDPGHTGLRSPQSVSKTVATTDSLSGVTRNGTCSSTADNQSDSGFQLDVTSPPDNPASPNDDDVNL